MNEIDPQLEELASGFREALRHSVYLVRRLDADG
ncbi:MAG TPA: MarR family transcriptional regulator, partial [Arthrobacter sp.]|nr:MarR family transcriptional regulator [Arthrobacter sp.]